jgi:hypothetical protein
MADTLTTVAQLLKLNDQNLDPAFANDLLQDAPLVRALSGVVANASQGTQHKYLKDTSAASAGFRPVNEGLDYTASDQSLVTLDLKVISANPRVDQAIAKAYPSGVEAFMDFEGTRALRAAFRNLETQLVYGTSADANGFAGMISSTYTNALADAMVYNAAGSANRTSVWLVRTGVEDVEMVLGNGGNIQSGETFEQLIMGSNSKLMPVFARVQEGLVGLKLGGAYSMGRIVNLAAGALTDDMIYEALALFPASRQPNLIIMNGRSLKDLRASRTATNATGAPAPIPTEVANIPILRTDVITNAEDAVA